MTIFFWLSAQVYYYYAYPAPNGSPTNDVGAGTFISAL